MGQTKRFRRDLTAATGVAAALVVSLAINNPDLKAADRNREECK